MENSINYVKKSSIWKVLFLYWFVLVVWQNIQDYQKMSSLDVAIKVILLIFLCFSFFKEPCIRRNKNLGLFLLFILSSILCALVNIGDDITLRTTISFLFPIIIVYLVYIVGDSIEISTYDYSKYLDLVIAVVVYMVAYSFIFKSATIMNAINATSAYMDALSSFLVSNHEYGMYLLFGIIACLYQISYTNKKKFIYVILIPFFLANLVLTYSRTSQVAAIVFILIFALQNKNRRIKVISITFIVVCVFGVLSSPSLRSFFTDIVIRKENNSGRLDLWEFVYNVYKNGDAFQKLFGHGYGTMVITETGHISVHNAYLQVLIVNGIIGLLLLIIALAKRIVAALRATRYNVRGIYFFAVSIVPVFLMLTNTSVLFHSPIDSSMMTFFCLVIPKYVMNSIQTDYYDNNNN